MTLVALFNPNSPILISDVMLSLEKPPHPAFTPGGAPIVIAPARKWNPGAFSQKTYLHDNGQLALFGSGDLRALQMAASDLHARVTAGMEPHDLTRWLGGRSRLLGATTDIMVAWFSNRDWIVAGAGKGWRHDRSTGTEISFSGSGDAWLKQNLITRKRVVEQIGEADPNEYVLMQAIAQTGRHLVEEHIAGSRETFGGGFQVTRWNGECFTTENVLHMFWSLDEESSQPKLKLIPMLVAQYSGYNELAFDAWAFSDAEMSENDDFYTWRGVGQARRTPVRSLLFRPGMTESRIPVPLQTMTCLNTSIIRHRGGSITGLDLFTKFGDSNLSPVQVTATVNGVAEVRLAKNAANVWMRL